MVELQTPTEAPAPDRTTRSAALWATVVAVPVAVLVGLLIYWQVVPGGKTTVKPKSAVAQPAALPSTPVQLAAPALNAATAQICVGLISQLPTKVRSLLPRKVSAGSDQNAAYGEPALTVACGVTQPTLCERVDGGHTDCVPLDATMVKMNDVCWYAQSGPATNVFTTMDRDVAVRVVVPASYDQAAQWANEFSDPVAETIKAKTAGVPSGCPH